MQDGGARDEMLQDGLVWHCRWTLAKNSLSMEALTLDKIMKKLLASEAAAHKVKDLKEWKPVNAPHNSTLKEITTRKT